MSNLKRTNSNRKPISSDYVIM